MFEKEEIMKIENMQEAGKDKILQEDLEYISKSNLDFSNFQGKTFLVTGATGLIGSLIIKTLLYCNRVKKLQLKIIGVIRSKSKAAEVFGECLSREELELWVDDMSSPTLGLKTKVDYIIHAASVTASRTMIENPVETIKISIIGTLKLLEKAKRDNIDSMIYMSSMEVYGSLPDEESYVDETKLGFIDLFNVRSSYPESKRMCENLCRAFAEEYQVNVVSARLAQTFGPGILKDENRVFAQFARSVIKREDIILHTLGNSEGNYCYTRDAIEAILLLLYKGKRGESYNISNEENHITIKEMAEMLVEELGEGKIKVLIKVSDKNMGYAPDVKLKLNAEKMRNLGWTPTVNLKSMYERLIQSMKTNGYNI